MAWFDSIVEDIDKKYKVYKMIETAFRSSCLDIKKSLKANTSNINLNQATVDNIVCFKRISFDKFYLKLIDKEIHFGIKEIVRGTIINKSIFDCDEEEIKEAIQYFINNIYEI
ncbi:MAG: hypothetical protein H7Y18_20605 [Clostridiaceae bacterium]|nr:hypothetical protein [Clostridiaceae bacterium]